MMHAYMRSHSSRDAWIDESDSESESPFPSKDPESGLPVANEGLARRKRPLPPSLTTVTNSVSESTESINKNTPNDREDSARQTWSEKWMQSHWPLLLISFFIFAVLAASGLSLFMVIATGQEHELMQSALDIATETGDLFSKELDFAILPLFSMAQFASELDIFSGLPDKIKSPGEEGALPFSSPPNSTKVYRDVTGVCDEPALVQRFTHLASAVKTSAKMDGVLHNIQLAPQGVICLLHPMNNTEDFDDGKSFLDNSGAWGIDLLHDPFHRYIARESLKGDKVGIVGPRQLFQCPDCGMYFIVRLPVSSRMHTIMIDGEAYPRWGFATALINWDALVNRSQIHQRFESNGFEFKLTRTDRNFNDETNIYDEEVVVLSESAGYGTKSKEVSTVLETTNNEWVMYIQYDPSNSVAYAVAILCTVVVSFFIAVLVYIVLVQKQVQTSLQGTTMAEKAKVELERHLTAALAHELRNPLGCIDSALATMPNDIPAEAKELVASMSLCSTFMQSILNNLLDSRKLEEGKMTLLSNPFSLVKLLKSVYKMMLPAVNINVKLLVDTSAIPPEKEWVYGDFSRLQQVLTNLVSNACKHTRSGSITISARWVSPPAAKNASAKFKNEVAQEVVQIMCSDTGPGIPKDDQDNLFNRFTTRGGVPGSGLGLAIARQIVLLAGGSIRFESDPTVKPGTDCIVLLPFLVCQDVPQKQPPQEEKAPADPAPTMTVDANPIEKSIQILLTDDIKMNRMMLKRRFQKCIAPNCTIIEAATGEEALKICEDTQFDIIVMDQYMQEAGGVMVGTDAIIAMRRTKIDAVIVGCSGNDLDDKFLAAGADLVWKKPVPSNEEIIKSLRTLLSEKERL